MKQIRVFSSEEIRDAVLDAADYSILYVTEGVGVGLKTVVSGPDYSEPFYVENITNETETLTIALYDIDDTGNVINIPVEYSTDRINWNSLGTTGYSPLTKALEPGDKLYLRATTDAWSKPGSAFAYGNSIYGMSKVGGNIMSLLYGSNFTGNERSFPNNSTYTFNELFSDWYGVGNLKLIDASKLILPATTLTEKCYSGMFHWCNLLTQTPELPATTLADYCYTYMFNGCESLISAPELPATILTTGCYDNMFSNCILLNYIKCLATDISAEYCLNYWTEGVPPTGTFVKAAGVTYPTGDHGIPEGWTVEEI